MPTFKIELQGAQEFLELLNELSNTSNDAGGEALVQVAEQFVSNAQADAPVLTGYLRDNIEITDQSSDSVTVESSAPYSGFVDGGTIYQEPQPFFTGNVERLASEGGMVEATDEIMQYWQELCDRLAP